MAVIAAARKSRLHNALERIALTATLQSFPTFVAFASLAHALLAVAFGPSLPSFFKTVYEPKFFEAHLSLSDKITAWRTQPVASLQFVTIVLLLSVMAVVTASLG
ncbi:hypothetical protein IVA80_34015 [Bradyrhizobium sp. 139]|uniref:hypothetical protein n=1 Tax=Bradyrhizobium sp. 139 TaxID=2782616 RepID=UPI001FF94A7F|nr:hypothetical protein [Bradyrhizobium sp. 139]MCK1745648.1 hypothetical protein [Bradyrhizobium sp. 139]